MVDIGIISGSGFYDFPGLEHPEDKQIETKFGTVPVRVGSLNGKSIAFITRHGKNHEYLPHMINHRANILALHSLGVKLIIGTTVCGVLKQELPLAKIIIFDDLFYLDNKLPNGETCTLFTSPGESGRGHYLFPKPFSPTAQQYFSHILPNAMSKGGYAYVTGPRFNSQLEITFLSQHADYLSQTAGPEAVLAGEVEIPYVLLGFSIDYANGVTDTPTPIDVLQSNLQKSKGEFIRAIETFIAQYKEFSFEGFVYRF